MGLAARERGRDFQLHGFSGEREREGGTFSYMGLAAREREGGTFSYMGIAARERGRDFQLHGFSGEREGAGLSVTWV